jgi:hypothetical protein
MTHSGQPRMNIRRCVLGAFLRDLSQAQQFFERVESFGLVSLIAREDFGQNFGGALMGKPQDAMAMERWPTATTRTARKLSWPVVSVRPTRRSFRAGCLPTL